MIRGEATIELFDAKTGELQKKVKEHNLVTNALRYMMNIVVACGGDLEEQVFPIATRALGGIILFDGPLDEDVKNVYLPTKGTHIVGYAGTDTNTSDVNRGSFNSAESGPIDNGYKSVWDFGTSQANGTIRSAARTSAWAGRDPLRYYNGLYRSTVGAGCPSSDTYWTPFRYDGEYVYLMKIDSDSHTARVYKARRPMLRRKVADYSKRNENFTQVGSFSTKALEFSYMYNDGTRTAHYYAENPKYYFDGGDGYLYCIKAGWEGSTDSRKKFEYFTVKYSDDSFEKSDNIKLTLGEQAYCSVDNYSTWDADQRHWNDYWHANYFNDASQIRIRNGYLYVIQNGRKRILQVNLKNPVDQKSIQVIEDGSPDYIVDFHQINLPNGGVMLTIYHVTTDGYEYRNGIMYEDGTLLIHDFDGTNNNDDWYNIDTAIGGELERFGYYTDVRIDRGYIANYLGTIANLSSPIEKNASQTMKITYTLVDIDKPETTGTETTTGGEAAEQTTGEAANG